VALCTVALAGVVVSSASAAFPGGDGLLAVQPVRGPGVVLVNSRGGRERRVCVGGGACGVVMGPRWSPDGRVIGVSSRRIGGVALVYPDGSCLDCEAIAGSGPAFTANPAVVTVVSGGQLREYGSDGVPRATLFSGGVSDAVWSSRGELAVVRSSGVWVGAPGRLRSLGRGDSPSWSPDGSRAVIDRRGWVTVVGVDHRFARRVAKGSAPAWSPDGRSIAFIAAGHELSVVSAAGGRVRRVGRVQGVAVDWQPIPVGPVAGCLTPPGSTTIASSGTAVVSSDSRDVPGTSFPAPAYLGCLRADGRERLLARFDFQSEDATTIASEAAVGGDYAGLVRSDDDPHYGGLSSTVEVFDLRTGANVSTLGGEQVSCGDYSYDCVSGMDDLVLGADGVSAAHTTSLLCCTATVPLSADRTERIVASDSTGVHVLDTVASASPASQPVASWLTELQLSGDTLTWEQSGASKSAVLH
jgi:hypothetical protein